MSVHPIIDQLAPSDEQRPAALARGCDVAVTAGAGAGKTRTLVARYLSYIAEGVPLRAVVAITFTKKAAREMRNRVRYEIRRYLEDLESASVAGYEDAERWRAAYEQLDAARIGTIHSLCVEILRRHPAEAAIDPRFAMLEEGQMGLLRAQAVDAAMGWAAEDEATARLFDDFGERSLRQIVADMLAQRLEVLYVRGRMPDDLWAVWAPYLIAPLKAFLDDETVQSAFAELVRLRSDGTLDRAAAGGDALAPDLREALGTWDAVVEARRDGDWGAVSRALAPLRASLKQKGRAANWKPANPKAEIKVLQATYDEQLASLVGDGIDLDLDRQLAQQGLPALLGLFDYAHATYEGAKRARRALDFDDLESRALDLLQTHDDVRAAWQREVAVLLVDEFQDTNARQRDLLELLNGDGGKLFIVGDGKQSIYRFRGADVAVFREEREAIARRGQSYDLSTSYRAHDPLIKALNALLAPVLGAEDDPQRPYVEPFRPLRAHRELPAEGLAAPYIELYLAVGTVKDGATERAAEALAARLAALVASQRVVLPAVDEESGATSLRALNYGDIAILCRASTSFAAYEAALERAGIPYLTIAGRGFYDRPEVRDVVNALRALADPTDDLALAGLLRSPACGLTDLALYRLRQVQKDRGLGSLWVLLETGDLDFLGDQVTQAAEVRALVARLHARVGRVPFADVLKAFLDATTYRAGLLRAGQTRAANNVAKLLSDAHASGIVGVSAFLEYMAQLRDVAPREGEARALATEAIQIMSVHQAKGLEFPVVVIGDASKGGRSGNGVRMDPVLGIVPPLKTAQTADEDGEGSGQATSLAYRLAQARDADQEAAESDRLLYVAATRAQELLIVNGIVSARRDGIGMAGWLGQIGDVLGLQDQAPTCDKEGAAIHHLDLDLDGKPVTCTIYESQAAIPTGIVEAIVEAPEAEPEPALPMLALLSPVTAPRMVIDEALRDVDRDPPRRVWRVVPQSDRVWAPAWVVGQLVHLALRDWRFPDDDPGRAFHRWAASEARSCGLADEGEIANAIERADRMLLRFRTSSLYTAMDGADRHLREVPYSIADAAGTPDSGIIDALYLAGDRWTLVEFKTDHVRDHAGLDRLFARADYDPQMTRYLDAAERLLGKRPRGVMCFLNLAGRTYVVEDRW